MMENSQPNIHTDENLDRFFRIIKKHQYIIYTSVILSIVAGVVYLRFQNPIYRAYSIVKVKGDTKPQNINNVLLDLYSYDTSSVKEDIALLKTFYMNKKAIDLNKKSFVVQYFNGNREIYKNPPIEVFDIKVTNPEILKKRIIISPVGEDSFSIKLEETILDRVLAILDKREFELEEKVYKYNQLVTTKYFSFKVKKLSNFNSPITIKLNGDSRNIYEKIIKKSLSVSQLEDEVSLIEIAYNDNIRQRAIEYIDTLTEIFIKESIFSKSEQSNKILEFINKELDKMRQRVERSERELERYRVSNDVISPSAQASTLIQDLSNIDIQISQNRIKKKIVDNLVNMIENNYRVDAIAPSLVQLNDTPTLRLIELLQQNELKKTELLSEYTYKHPEVITTQENIDNLRAQIKENILNLQEHMENVQRDLMSMKRAYEKRLKKLPVKERRLINLKRDYEVSSKMYNFLLEKQAENEIIKASTISDYKIIDRAYSSNIPVSPNRVIVLISSAILGVILGVILALLKEKTTERIEDSDIIEDNKIKLYGEVLEGFLEEPNSKVLQSYRDIRANLQLILKDVKGAKKIFITSISPSSSKDIFSSNLGIIFQLANYKTIIVDLNFKRPRIHRLFKIGNIDCGISDYLRDECSINEIIYSTKHKNLHLIPVGNSFKYHELILDSKLIRLISKLKGEYDYIILNGASIKEIPDIKQFFLMSSLNIIYIKQYYTRKQDLEVLKRMIKEFSLPNIGVVFEKRRYY